MWNFELFEEDISEFSYKELAEWIISCRQYILKSNFDSVEDYQNAVHFFCYEWEEHYKQNEKIYKSEKFNKAILYIGRREKLRFKVDFGQGVEDITESVLANTMSVVFVEKAKKIADEKFNKDLKTINDSLKACFKDKGNFKEELNKIIANFIFNKTNFRIRVFKDNKWIKDSSYKEFLIQCEDLNNYNVEEEEQKSYTSYLKALDDYDIASTNYTDYMNIVTAEKALDKKFFVNLAFALSLPYSFAERLLKYNGFSFFRSVKMFDILCEKAFRIGFGRTYLIALIDKYNADMRKIYPRFVEVQNITKIKKNNTKTLKILPKK